MDGKVCAGVQRRNGCSKQQTAHALPAPVVCTFDDSWFIGEKIARYDSIVVRVTGCEVILIAGSGPSIHRGGKVNCIRQKAEVIACILQCHRRVPYPRPVTTECESAVVRQMGVHRIVQVHRTSDAVWGIVGSASANPSEQLVCS